MYLEQEWNIWNMFLGESVVELLESGASFTYVDREHEKRTVVMAERRSRKIDESKETAHDNI